MRTVTIDAITEKLKNTPSSILEKIWGYADALLENNELTYMLTEEQKGHLLKQNDVPLNQCMDAEEVYQQVKQKYEL
ncbi:hypothetical protein RF683_06215 [Flavobacterium sp. 20NA77.7]|uniref:Addiction module component n=1 Tax=Flavobacterium nakdongensis TaxID=3073563 RepID=A0ABY9R748_9FLAO|nr:hypothetical protein [Flavobacterium sp. 20NA77.7]WMW77090.1 hypothetical protein RF683_06215 [Flavobacterium sp. 20NA77.7]